MQLRAQGAVRPVALAMAEILGLPYTERPACDRRVVLLCSAVLKGPVEAVRVEVSPGSEREQPPHLHFCPGAGTHRRPDQIMNPRPLVAYISVLYLVSGRALLKA